MVASPYLPNGMVLLAGLQAGRNSMLSVEPYLLLLSFLFCSSCKNKESSHFIHLKAHKQILSSLKFWTYDSVLTTFGEINHIQALTNGIYKKLITLLYMYTGRTNDIVIGEEGGGVTSGFYKFCSGCNL